jgi:trans-2,3-dihydro-3-hydroxyanthranilate isomerase
MNVQYRFFICDVFTTERFGGNQLAVLPDAQGLSTGRMQQITREFNYSESTFVTPGHDSLSRNVRIFTPSIEIPFAGHPNVGTAFALANDGAFGDIGDGITVTFAEAAGAVPVSVRRDDEGRIWCELEAPEQLSIGDKVDAGRIAAALSLDESDIVTSTHEPQVASVGLPFLMVELASTDALARAKVVTAGLESLREDGITPDVHMYVRSNDEVDIRARMFAPLDGVPEDPATGSANCALVALLTEVDEQYSSGGSWRIAQGVEMGRPSILEARACREEGTIKVWIGGYSVLVAEGSIDVD